MAKASKTNVTTVVQLCQDGKYRWVHEMNLYKDPTILLLLLKIFAWVCFGIWVLFVLLQIFDSVGSSITEKIWFSTKVMLIVSAVFMVLCVISYYIYALIMGGKYCMLFEMDEQGIMNRQMKKQVEKARLIGAITALAGIASRNLTTTAVGLNAGARTEMYSVFSSVKSVQSFPNRLLIKVNESFNHNQVYASPGDYEFVLNYILDHVQPAVREKFDSKQ